MAKRSIEVNRQYAKRAVYENENDFNPHGESSFICKITREYLKLLGLVEKLFVVAMAPIAPEPCRKQDARHLQI